MTDRGIESRIDTPRVQVYVVAAAPDLENGTTLMIKAVNTSETSANIYLTTWCKIPEDSHFNTRNYGNVKSHKCNLLRLELHKH
jgi:hypothetical protein